MMTGMILIDLQKAFDTIDHDVLLQKLYAIAFSKRTVGLSLISPTDLLRLIQEIIVLNLHLCPMEYPVVLFWVHSCL